MQDIETASTAEARQGASRWVDIPALVAFGINGALATALLAWGAHLAGGFAYPLDDTYIHMATAWNWLSTGVYGLNPGEFSSPSTSPVWVAVLASSFALVGKRIWLPFLLELLCSAWLFAIADARLLRAGLSRRYRAAALLVITMVATLPVVTTTSMEHLAQTAVVLLLVDAGERASRGEKVQSWAWFAIIGGVLPLLRVETTLLLGLVAWGIRRDRPRVLGLIVGASASILAFGIWNHAQGGLWVPNTLVMKSLFERGLDGALRENLAEGSTVFVVATAVAASIRTRPARSWLLWMTCAHFLAGSFGWMGRYEAYLVVWGVLLLAEERPWSQARTLSVLALAAVLCGSKSEQLLTLVPQRILYIHDLKESAGLALAEVAPDTTVCIHDVGAFAWYAQPVRIIDVAGLGTNAVAREAAHGTLDRAAFSRICREGGATVAFTATSWLGETRPEGWEQVGTLWWGNVPGERLSAWRVEALEPGARGVIERWMAAAVGRMANRGVFLPNGSLGVALTQLTIDGGLVERGDHNIGMYTNGSVSFTAPADGNLVLTVSGSAGPDGPARLVITDRAGSRSIDAPLAPTPVAAGPVHADEHVEVAFVNDATAPGGIDRNAYLWRVEIRP